MDINNPNPSVTGPVAAAPSVPAQPAPAPGVSVQPAPGQGEGQPPAPANPVSAQEQPQAQAIPYDRFKEVNDAKKAAEDQVSQLQGQVLQMQSYLTQLAAQRQQSQQSPQAPQTPLDRYRQNPNEFLDPMKQLDAMQAMYDDLQNKLSTAVQQLTFQSQYSDFNTLVGTQDPFTGAWRPSDLMQEAMKEDPSLGVKLQQLAANPQAMKMYAYDIAKRQAKIHELQAKQNQPITPTNPTPVAPAAPTLAQAIQAAQRAPVSISAASGTGSMSREQALAQMTPAEFDRRWEQQKKGGPGAFWA